MISNNITKLIAIVGPTASGKTVLSLELAQRHHGEIVSADSRTVYRGMDIGTAKPTRTQQALAPHHLIDIADPDETVTLSRFQQLAIETIHDILTRGALPFLVGGTALYTYAIIDSWQIPEVAPNPKLRAEYESQSTEALWNKLMAHDRESASFVDQHNKRRIIRALEVINATGKPFSDQRQAGPRIFDTFKIGLRIDDEQQLRQTISDRTDEMLANGLIAEVETLLAKGYASDLPAFSGIHYREVIDHLQGKTSQAEMIELINTHDWQLTRRQLTWYKKDPAIHWVSDLQEADILIRDFLASK